MAPIRDWTGAITISPLPYCEIAAVGNLVWGLPQPTEAQHSGFAVGSFPTWGGHCVWVCV